MLTGTVVDCSELTTREINQQLRTLAAEGLEQVTLTNPAGRHNLAVGMDTRMRIQIAGPVGYYCGGLSEQIHLEIDGNCGWSVGENLMAGQILIRGSASANAAATARGGTICILGNAGPRAGISLDSEEVTNLLEKQQNSYPGVQTKVTPTTEAKEKQGMIITIFNNKGGVGKTTLTINLAAALNSLGKRVLLIDIDPQANLTTGLGVDPLKDVEYEKRKDISDLLIDPRLPLEQVILKRRWGNVQLDIVPSHIRLSDMEATLIMTPDIDRVLKKKLKKYTTEYDYIFIDPPPSFGKVNTIALMASSGVLVPTQLAPYPIRALEYVVNRAIAIDQSRDGEPLPILGVAVSMYNRTAHKLARNMVDEIVNVLAKRDESKNVELFPEKTWIPSLSMISVASGKGYPVCFAEYDNELDQRDKEAAQDALNCYINLAKHLIQKTGV
ncbi:AAA family ATPase [Leptolyngbya sp. 7M]|uniref:AAA family ATPase n=1 Tax=Leptolyngbya sp. 7M TaxID=2812896 RepID=UPI0039779E82